MIQLVAYGGKPGSPTVLSTHWPSESTLLRSPDLSTLVIFLHPQCPCSRATLAELGVLTARCQGRFVGHVLFPQPSDVASDWDHTELRTAADAIPGLIVATDHDAIEARRFSVAVSGHTLLYDAAGRLRFSGGLTRSRGHAGDNAGRSAIVSILLDGAADTAETPVYGCPLFSSDSVSSTKTESCPRN